MAIAVDSAGTIHVNAATTTQTYSHTTSGSDRILFTFGIKTGNNVTGVTYNGVAMTQLAAYQSAQSLLDYVYYIVAPATGANNIVWSASGSGTFVTGSVSYTGVNQTTPIPTTTNSSTATNINFSHSITTTLSNSWALAFSRDSDGAALTLSTGIKRVFNDANGCNGLDSNGTVSVGTYTFVGTYSAGTPSTDVVLAELAATVTSAVKTAEGLAIASVKTGEGLATASVKTWQGLA